MDLNANEARLNARTKEEQPPTPAPGWVCVLKTEEEVTEPVTHVQQVGPARMVFQEPQVDIIGAVVIEIGDHNDEWYELNPDYPRNIASFKVGSKVYFVSQSARDIKGYQYIQWDAVICYE